jgi:hypothetical protein
MRSNHKYAKKYNIQAILVTLKFTSTRALVVGTRTTQLKLRRQADKEGRLGH